MHKSKIKILIDWVSSKDLLPDSGAWFTHGHLFLVSSHGGRDRRALQNPLMEH